MIDIKKIRENPEKIIELLARKGKDAGAEIRGIIELDELRRRNIARQDGLKAEQNRVSRLIPQMKKTGEDTAAVMAEMKELSDEVKAGEEELREIEEKYRALMLTLPNPPDEDIAAGGKENNEEIRSFGEPPVFGFEPKNHMDLCAELGLIDYPRGAKLAGSGFWVYRGMGSRLEWALLNYFIDTHINDGYELIFPPHMLNYEAGLTAGQFPKFDEDVFWLQNAEGARRRFMLPTAETALVSLHMDEILKESDLPRKYIAYTPCYRREAGSYRADERGMVRGHQFNKVEMVQYTLPEKSDLAFEELLGKAEALVRGLGFHFRTTKLAAGDCSGAMARTYDIEIYIPSMGYKEVSSVSTSRDYQARRGNMRFRREETGKNEFLHTLNGSGLATSRLLPAIVEQNQQKDGSIIVPEVLRRYMGGVEVIESGK